jgi:hypothetical protein
MKDNQKNASPENQKDSIQGRSIFIVETTASGISIQTGFLAEDGRLIQMPAIFPTQEYALSQLDSLRQLIVKHFAEAALIGAQVIAQNNQSVKPSSSTDYQGPCPDDTIQ